MFKAIVVPAFALALLVGLASCGPMNREADTAARQLYTDIHDGNDLSHDPLAGPLAGPDVPGQLAASRQIMPAGAATSVDLRGQSFQTDGSGGHATLTHVYHYADRSLVVETVMDKPPGSNWRIIGWRVTTEMTGGGAYHPPATPAGPAPEAGPPPEETNAAAPAEGDGASNAAEGEPPAAGGDTPAAGGDTSTNATQE